MIKLLEGIMVGNKKESPLLDYSIGNRQIIFLKEGSYLIKYKIFNKIIEYEGYMLEGDVLPFEWKDYDMIQLHAIRRLDD